MKLKAPFPYFGGKSAVAAEVWRRFGNVKNYVEPFFGSGAVLLGRPHWRPDGPRLVETVNDADGLLANFWRAMTADAEAVAHHADWPVNEADLHARHLWLVGQRERITERLMADPEWFDAKAAGWWVWGACAWIGSGWCSGNGPWVSGGERLVHRDDLGNAGQGINRQLPHVGNAGRGINRQLPHVGDAGRAWGHIAPLADRLRDVRVACGDWTRVLGAALWPFTGSLLRPLSASHLRVGVFLDAPYGDGFDGAYASTDGLEHDRAIADDVWAWAVEHGDIPQLRICVAGYDDGREVPDGWVTVAWDATQRSGGAGFTGRRGAESDAGKNAKRERLWFSPHCLDPDAGQMALFGGQ
ncbi:MAG: DNA adenine methylase, partial [Myxococcales bacterium]|nr:DNA adenine methylase [Myxococcales bacterium]